MSRILLIIVAITISFSSSLSAKNEILWADYIFNEGDDKNFVLLGYNGIYKVNLETNEIEQGNLENSNNNYDFVRFNAEKKRIASKNYDKHLLKIHNYETKELISSFEIQPIYDEFTFSKDGNSIYTLNTNSLSFKSYDVLTGEVVNEFSIDTIFKSYPVFFNTDKEEIVLSVDSSLVYWSITENKLSRTIYINNNVYPANFLEEGKLIAYLDNGVFKIDSTSDGTNLVSKRFFEDSVYFKFSFYNCEICGMYFTSDNRYLLFNYGESEQIIYDITLDSIITLSEIDSISNKKVPFINAINSDFSKSIVSYTSSRYCARYAEMPVISREFYILDNRKYKNISSIPKGYVRGRTNYLFGDNNDNVILSTDEFNVLINKEEEFIQYIETEEKPVLLFNSSKSVLLKDSELLKVYNLETNQIEVEYDIGINYYDKYHYSNVGNGKVIAHDFRKVVVYNLSDFSLDSEFDFFQYGIDYTNIKFDGHSLITSYKDLKIYKYDIITQELTISNEILTPDDFIFRDFSSDGRFILYQNKDNKTITRYDVKRKEFLHGTLKGNRIDSTSRFEGIGFLGHREFVWYEYETDFITRKTSSLIYDFLNDTEKGFDNEGKPIISDYGDLFIGSRCPDYYSVNTIRDPQTSVETTTPITGGVYPNPASDFIKLDMNASDMNSSIEIYDAYGKQVMSTIYTGEDIDISSLTAGVYFVKVGASTHKFVKM
jgi:hypothetical protein